MFVRLSLSLFIWLLMSLWHSHLYASGSADTWTLEIISDDSASVFANDTYKGMVRDGKIFKVVLTDSFVRIRVVSARNKAVSWDTSILRGTNRVVVVNIPLREKIRKFELQNEINHLEDIIRRYREDIMSYNEDIERNSDEIEDLETDREALLRNGQDATYERNRIIELKHKNEEFRSKVRELEQEIELVQRDIDQLSKSK